MKNHKRCLTQAKKTRMGRKDWEEERER